MLTALLFAAAQTPPPPIVTVPHAALATRQPRIVEFEASEVLCDGVAVRPSTVVLPLPLGTLVDEQAQLRPYTLSFRIDRDGRPLSVGNPVRTQGDNTYLDSSDLAPALAAWRFASGGARTGCIVRFTPRAYRVAEAPEPVLYRFLALPRLGGAGWREAGERARTLNATCGSRAPRPRLAALPDYDAIAEVPGGTSWTLVGFDLDAGGKPRRVRTLYSGGNNALDAAGRAAIGGSTYERGAARSGCTYPFYRRQQTPLAAPAAPERDSFVGADARCDNSVNFVSRPELNFPEPFRRRAIEGWATIRYDVAPWGATGNVTVLASEPAAAFGEVAKSLISLARRPVSASGATGCVDRVAFKMPPRDD